MKLSQLEFDYPEDLVAQIPASESRVLLNQSNNYGEISKQQLLEMIQPGDAFVVNDTKVVKRRIYARLENKEEFEILFSDRLNEFEWHVLCRSGRMNKNQIIHLPEGVNAHIMSTGIPQVLKLDKNLDSNYFETHGEMPVPPYIQKARGSIHNLENESLWYQTQWAEIPGSQAAPTASFHFSLEDLNFLKQKNVNVLKLTLHVGLGTFLPIRVENLDQHTMHRESVVIPKSTWTQIQETQRGGREVWALGTTVARALESCALGYFSEDDGGSLNGDTNLLIQDNFKFQIVDNLLTNFHQPRSTLLALVCGFYGTANVLKSYSFAIDQKFRLFSYGDLTVWRR